jgi:hypothetical protein
MLWKATVGRWNANVVAGHDPDFRRGESWYDRWWGDPTLKGTKAATLGVLEGGPYYAVEVKSGAIGTKGGPRTDSNAQVLDVDLRRIEGLYAVGNVMASPMGYDLWGRWRHAGTGDGVRLSRGAPCRRACTQEAIQSRLTRSRAEMAALIAAIRFAAFDRHGMRHPPPHP